MSIYLIPTDPVLVDTVAKAIARGRIFQEATRDLTDQDRANAQLEAEFDIMFELLWAGTNDVDNQQRELYRNDALAAIGAINLKLMSSPE